jgi:hypothetical protein
MRTKNRTKKEEQTPATARVDKLFAVYGIWPIAVAIGVRIGVWWFVSPARLASDEDSYLRVGTALLTSGERDLFWPPVTGWLIALSAWVLQSTDVRWIRLAWIAMDIVCVAAVWMLARRVGAAVCGDDPTRAARFATVATLGYALYLPAVSFAQFATSEVPALMLVLLTLAILTGSNLSSRSCLGAGLLAGVLAVTRPSLLPLVLFWPAAAVMHHRMDLSRACLFVAAGLVVVAGVILRNYAIGGELTIAQNSSYNLYIGNRELYAEDLDLFHPVATPGQIEFRRQFFADELEYPTQTPAQLQQQAVAWIANHPGTFARRALGRLARVFAPKTDVLELIGGERAAGVLSPRSLALLTVANVQWVLVLFGGLVGLAALRRLRRELGDLLLATLLGSLPLCLIAISKPRYAFPFEPLLLIAAVALWFARDTVISALKRRDRWILAACSAFLVWGWAAWIVFAVTSRVALANTA